MIGTLALAARIARRELRGGLGGFRIFLACLALGVAAIAGVGSVSSAILAGLQADARKLLGGDLDLRLTHREATAEQLDWLRRNSAALSRVATLRGMAQPATGGNRLLVEVKAVDDAYPLFGALVLEDGGGLDAALRRGQGDEGPVWGAVAEPRLLEKLGVAPGAVLRLGDARLRVNGVIAREPDRGTQVFTLGPRLLISFDALAATGLVQPGSLVRYHYRIALPAGTTAEAWTDRVNARFPDAGWRIRDVENAAPGIQRFVDRATLFLTLVGLTALLVGGVGVGNAVRAFLAGRSETIATLKCLGAPGGLVFRIYLLQILALALLGIAIGLLFGAAAPFAAAPLLAEQLPIAARIGFYWEPLALAALFGILVTLVFSLWPLGRARDVPAAALFRAVVAPIEGWPRPAYLAGVAVAALLLAASAVLTAEEPRFALYFVAGACAALAAFRGAAWLIARLAEAVPRPRRVGLRLAIANIHRPGAPTASVVLSLGLGLTVLVAVALIEGNLARQVGEAIPENAPGYYYIDIQPDQAGAFDDLVHSFPGVEHAGRVPMLRGRITAIDGTPVQRITPPPDFAWIVRGDRGITWARNPPESGSRVVAGEWWAPDYAGPPLVSFDAEAARAFGLEIGDTIAVNVLGREITATVANLREIDWNSLGINFVMVFSPGLLEGAPQTHIATVRADAATERALERAVAERLPNVSAIRVRDVLERVAEIIGNLGVAVRAVAAVAIAAGTLVLAGAIAASHRRRVLDAVVLKVLGATRKRVLGAFLLEFGLLGLVTAAVAAAIGSVAAWAVMRYVMDADWVFLPGTVLATVVLCTAITLLLGLAGTWRALGAKPAPILRND